MRNNGRLMPRAISNTEDTETQRPRSEFNSILQFFNSSLCALCLGVLCVESDAAYRNGHADCSPFLRERRARPRAWTALKKQNSFQPQRTQRTQRRDQREKD